MLWRRGGREGRATAVTAGAAVTAVTALGLASSHGRSRPVTASHGRHCRSRPPRRWSRRPGSGGPEGASCGAE